MSNFVVKVYFWTCLNGTYLFGGALPVSVPAYLRK